MAQDSKENKNSVIKVTNDVLKPEVDVTVKCNHQNSIEAAKALWNLVNFLTTKIWNLEFRNV